MFMNLYFLIEEIKANTKLRQKYVNSKNIKLY